MLLLTIIIMMMMMMMMIPYTEHLRSTCYIWIYLFIIPLVIDVYKLYNNAFSRQSARTFLFLLFFWSGSRFGSFLGCWRWSWFFIAGALQSRGLDALVEGLALGLGNLELQCAGLAAAIRAGLDKELAIVLSLREKT
jgi:hypothetical protein